MKALALVFVVAAAGWAGATARADDPPPTTPDPPTPPPAATIAPGVMVGSVPVGGLTAPVATERVRATFALPLVLRYGTYVFRVSPESLATPAIPRAVQQAMSAEPNAKVPLAVTVRQPAVKGYVAEVSRRFARPPVDARLFLRNFKPWIAPEKNGREIDHAAAERALTAALQNGTRTPIVLQPRVLKPKVTRASFGPVIVVHRASNRLHLYRGTRLVRTFGVATGERRYPTPLGRFQIIVKWKHPWWYPPNSPWAQGAKPIPPGPNNPLGTRWMGISSPGVGIHGTPNSGSIGYSVSHGCIRMRIPDAEWLFERVRIGTPVFIVSA